MLLNNYIFSLFFLFLFFYNYNNSYDINYLSVFPIINSIPKSTLHAITGNMLGDGSISLSLPLLGSLRSKFSMTMDVYSLNYLHHLDNNIYSQSEGLAQLLKFILIQIFYQLRSSLQRR
jgi:hypothetical protein